MACISFRVVVVVEGVRETCSQHVHLSAVLVLVCFSALLVYLLSQPIHFLLLILPSQGLRTLELCVDNLNPDFLNEHINPVKADLMKVQLLDQCIFLLEREVSVSS